MTDLVGNERLLAARAEIEAILKARDIAGVVLLHAPGFIESFTHMTPSYSKLTALEVSEHGVAFHLRSKLADYNGDVQAQRRDQEATANMVRSMADHSAHTAIYMTQLADYIDNALHAEHGPATPVNRPKGRTQ